jgi:hypothetical protein
MFLRRMGATLFLFDAPSISPIAQSQTGSGLPSTDPVGESSRGPDGQKITNQDWKTLAGVIATTQKLALLDGGMSLRNLDSIYFRKPLHGLAKYNFSVPKTLKPFAKTRRWRSA